MTGSSALDEQQQDFYVQRFGKRYVRVQEQPLRPSRRVRRGRGNAQDHQVLRAQQATEKALREAVARPVL